MRSGSPSTGCELVAPSSLRVMSPSTEHPRQHLRAPRRSRSAACSWCCGPSPPPGTRTSSARPSSSRLDDLGLLQVARPRRVLARSRVSTCQVRSGDAPTTICSVASSAIASGPLTSCRTDGRTLVRATGCAGHEPSSRRRRPVVERRAGNTPWRAPHSAIRPRPNIGHEDAEGQRRERAQPRPSPRPPRPAPPAATRNDAGDPRRARPGRRGRRRPAIVERRRTGCGRWPRA